MVPETAICLYTLPPVAPEAPRSWVQGETGDRDEVVTRHRQRKLSVDHLLAKEITVLLPTSRWKQPFGRFIPLRRDDHSELTRKFLSHFSRQRSQSKIRQKAVFCIFESLFFEPHVYFIGLPYSCINLSRNSFRSFFAPS